MVSTLLSGPDDLIIIVVALVVIFGGSQLPKLARNAGDAMREFRKAGAKTGSGDEEPAAQVAGQPAPEQPVAVPQVRSLPPATTVPPPSPEERVTLSRAELDALLAAREASVRNQSSDHQS